MEHIPNGIGPEKDFDPAVVDLAWQALEMANATQIMLKEIDIEIAAGQQEDAADFSSGPLAEVKKREERTLEHFLTMAGVVYGHRQETTEDPSQSTAWGSEQAAHRLAELGVEEKLIADLQEKIAYGAPLRPFKEVTDFAVLQKYDSATATRAWRALFKESLRQKNISVLKELTDFTANTDEGVRFFYQGDELSDRTAFVEIDSAYASIKHWIEQGVPNGTRGMSDIMLGFWADYLNHARPSADEPLPILRRPKQRVQESQDMESMNAEEIKALLLDTHTIADDTLTAVSYKGIRRLAVAQGLNTRKTAHLAPIITEIATNMFGGSRFGLFHNPPVYVNTAISMLGKEKIYGGEMLVWGIAPDSFVQAIGLLESDPKLKVNGYAGATRDLILAYRDLLLEHDLAILPNETGDTSDFGQAGPSPQKLDDL